jgi:sarcosine oxidase subunit gamma
MLDRAREVGVPGGASLRVRSVDGRAVVRLKSWLGRDAGAQELVVIAGLSLPLEVGKAQCESGGLRALCVGPGDWLVVTDRWKGADLHAKIAADLSPHGLAVVDLSHGLSLLEVWGSACREVLSTGCGLDFHSSAFLPGMCARTRFAQITVIIECLNDPLRFELSVERSYIHYLRNCLIDADSGFERFAHE